MKSKAAVIGVVMICLLGLVPENGMAKEFISLLTCGTAGVYFPLGGGIARIWNSKVPEVNATAESSGCSVVNLRLMEQGQASTAICQNDAVFFAANGLKFFEGKKAVKARGVLMLYDEHVHVATTKQSGIKKIEDLRGKRVRIGFPGSIATENALILLEAYGLGEKDMKAYQMSLSDAFEQLKDGNIDVLIEPTGAPAAGFLDVAHSRDMVLLPVDNAHAEKIHKKYPFLSPAVIPAGTYRGTNHDLPTLAVTCMLVATSDLPTDLVYNLTKAIFQNLNILGEAHVKGKLVKMETALKGMPIPLHPGAEKYYKEVGKIK
jgi:TRAP transporter TAXI family solute receptor